MMKKYLFAFIVSVVLLSVQHTKAQILPQLGNWKPIGLKGTLMDSTFRKVIPLAHIIITHDKDTIKLVSDLSGNFSYLGKLADTMQVQVTAVGFKPFIGWYIPNVHSTVIRIGLRQEAVMLNEIIVTAKRLAIVVKGDTLVYDPGVIKNLEGDMLSDILKKMPGVSVDNGLMVNGIPIARISVNGNDSLFEKTEALNHIAADNVKSIQVFNTHNKQDQKAGLKYGRIEKVMDVTTHREVKPKQKQVKSGTRRTAPNYTLTLGGGADASRERTAKFTEKFLFGFNMGKDGSKGGFGLNTNYSNLFLNDQKEFNGSLRYRTSFMKKNNVHLSYESEYNYNNTTTYDHHWNEEDYFPTEQYNSRHYNHTSSDKNMVYQYATKHTFSRIGKQFMLYSSGAYSYRANKKWQNSQILSTMDAKTLNSANIGEYNRDYTSQGNFNIDLQKYIKRSQLRAKFALDLLEGGQTGWQMDTLEASSQNIYLDRDWKKKKFFSDGQISLRRTITPLWSLLLSNQYQYTKESSKGVGTNRLTHQIDTNNTRDYSHYNFSYFGNIELSQYQKNRQIRLKGGIHYQLLNRVERFPIRKQTKDHFINFDGEFHLQLEPSPTHSILVWYLFSALQATADQLRDVIDNTNPLSLKAGNPNLKPRKIHRLTLNYNKILAKQAAAFQTKIYLDVEQDPIASNSRYFIQTEYLPEYNYTVVQGATLYTFENTKPKYALHTKIDFEKFLSFLGKCTFSVEYKWKKEPSFTQGKENDLTRNEGTFGLSVRTNFSKKVIFYMKSSSTLSRSNSQLAQANKSFAEILSLNARTTIIPKFNITSTLTYNYSKNFTVHQEASTMNLKASISRNLGKNFSMQLTGDNLLDSKKNKSLNKTAEFVSRSGSSQTGRYVYMKLTHKF